jgi:tetratricopeptide (TPR) repeat protein
MEPIMSEDAEWHRKLESLRTATHERPDDGLAWSALGDFLYHKSDNPKLAVRAYERARELLPGTDMRLRLGSAYVQNGEADKGFAMIRASAEERPRAEAYCFLADACYRSGREADSEEAARTAIKLEPCFEEGYYLLAEALKNRDRAAAIDAYRRAVSLDDKYALAWQGLGRELTDRGDLEEGISALTTAVSLDPEDVWSRVFLANALWKANRPAAADEQYLAAIVIAPEFVDVKRWYAEFTQWRRNQAVKP